MNDVLSVKPILTNQIGSTQLGATALDYNRTISPANDYRRINTALGSLSPTIIRISHQPRKVAGDVQRSLFSVDQTLQRVDAQSNPVSSTKTKCAFQSDIPADMTLAEWKAAACILFGALLASDGALLTAMYNGEY